MTRIALAGAGAFGIKHLDGLKNIPGVEIVSIISRTAEQRAEVAAKYGAKPSTELEDALARDDVDAVILCTPTQMHASQTIACLEAGKHVQVEIPLCDSLAEGEAVLAKQQETGLVAMVGHTRRFNPSHQYIHDKIVAGDIAVQQMDVQTYFFRRKNLNALGQPRSWTDHLLWHHAAHTVDLFAYQAGPIVQANAVQGPTHPELGIAMDMSIQLKAESGAICTLSLSFNNDGPLGTFFRYICDNGTWIARYDDLVTGQEEPIDLSGVAVSNNGIELQDREFIAAIREGREPNSSVAQVLPCYRVLDAARAAARRMKTQVAIIGSGPAGLLLGHLLRAEGIDAVVVERQTQPHVLCRIRAGVLEQTTTDLLHRLGIDARLNAEGLPDGGFALADGERLIRIDLAGAHRQACHRLRPDRGDARPDRGGAVARAGDRLELAGHVAIHGIDGDARHRPPRRRPDDRGRFRRRLRRLPRPRAQGAAGIGRARISSAPIRSAGSASSPKCRRATMS